MDRVGDEQPPRMSDDEKRLARKWWHEGKTQPEIASLLSRHKSSMACLSEQVGGEPAWAGREGMREERQDQ